MHGATIKKNQSDVSQCSL